MIKLATNVQTMLVKQAAKVKTQDIDFGGIDSIPNTVMDYVHGIGGGGAATSSHAAVRGSVYQTLAEAAGLPSKEVGFTVKRPLISSLLSTLGGGLGGAGLGLLGGVLVDRERLPMYGAGGGIAGMLAANLMTTIARRNEMRRIADAFEQAKSLKKLKPLDTTFGERLSTMFSDSPIPAIRNATIEQIEAVKKGK